jgi:prepilin-type N-terminal cleavage/methylation domain-containing protein
MKKNSGYTLIEVLIAMLIFAINMLFAFTFFTYGNQSKVRSEETNFALNIARDEIEAVKAVDYDHIPLDNTVPVTIIHEGTKAGETTAGKSTRKDYTDSKTSQRLTYTYWVGVQEIKNWNDRYMIVQATVTWRDGEKAVSLTTIVAPKL